MVWETVTLVLGITDKLLDKTPNYDQRQREKWKKVVRLYNEERTKAYPERDDDLLLNLRDEILLFSAQLNAFIEQKQKEEA